MIDPDGMLPARIFFEPGPGGVEDPRSGYIPGAAFFISRMFAQTTHGPGRGPRMRPSEIAEERRQIDFARTNAVLKGRLAEALSKLDSDCFEALERSGLSSGDLAAIGQSINFYDATTSLGSLRQDQITGNGIRTSLANSYPGVNAYVISDRSGKPTNNVVIKANYYGGAAAKDPVEQNAILVHEALHVAFRIGDQELRSRLQVPTRFGMTGLEDSPAISDWLQAGCPKQ
jgi:hypothetical protein